METSNHLKKRNKLKKDFTMIQRKPIVIDILNKDFAEKIYLIDGITKRVALKLVEFLEAGGTFKNDEEFYSFLKKNKVSERYLKDIRKNVTIQKEENTPEESTIKRCTNIYELKVYLKKITYIGDNIGRNIFIDFKSDGGKYVIDYRENPEKNSLKLGAEIIYDKEHLIYYKRLFENEIPHSVQISTTITEEDLVYDDFNPLPVMTTDYIVDKKALTKPIMHEIEIVVHEDANPRKKKAKFKCKFESILKQICSPIPPKDFKFDDKTSSSPYDEFFNYLEHEPLIAEDAEILAFVSDLHIGADECVDDFGDDDEQIFISMLRSLSALKSKRKELILLGDTLELWETEPFYQPSESEIQKKDKIKTKIDKIVLKHQALFDALSAFGTRHKTTYVYGNHDDELDSDHFSNVSGFKGTFAFEFKEKPFNVSSQHGHVFDDKNYTKDPLNNPPTGKWIVENLVVPLERIKAKEGGCGPFGDIDGFMKSSEFARHIQCLIRNKKIPSDLKKQVNEIIDNVAKNTPLKGIEAWGQNLINIINKVKELKGDDPLEQFEDLSEFIEKYKLGISIKEKNYSGILNNGKGCALMGHTHGQFVKPIDPFTVHVNTGTWMDKYRIEDSDECKRIGMDTRHLTILIKGKNRFFSEIRGEGVKKGDNGTPIVKVYQYSIFPNGTKQLATAEYIL